MMEIKTFNFKNKQSSKALDNILKNSNGFTKGYILPRDTYDRLMKSIDVKTMGIKNVISYFEILVRISLGHKTNQKRLIKIDRNYRDIINNLIDNNIIIWSKIYQRNFNSEDNHWFDSTPNEYKLVTSDSGNFTFIFVDTNEDIVNPIIKNTLETNAVINRTLAHVEIDWQNAIVAEYDHVRNISINDQEFTAKFTSRVNNIFKSLTERMMVKGKKVDRIYSTFTMLSSIARQFLHIDGQYFHSIDLRNAQPTLLVSLLEKNNLPIDYKYIMDVSKGKFYEAIMDSARKDGIISDTIKKNKKHIGDTFYYEDRDHVKILSYRGIFFHQHEKKHIWKIFSKLYPKTAQSIKCLKSSMDSKETLASSLQNMEANIFHNIILTSEYFIVHDAVYFINIDEKKVIKHQINTLFGDKMTNKYKLKYEKAKISKISNINKGGIVYANSANTIKFHSMNKPHKPHKDHKPHNLELKKEISDLLVDGFNSKQIFNLIGDKYDVKLKTVRNNISKIKKERRVA